MNLLDSIIKHIAPHYCPGCGQIDELICPTCVNSMMVVPPRCYRCLKATKNFRTCPPCRSSSSLRSVIVLSNYEGIIKEVIHKLKYERAMLAAENLVAQLPVSIHIPENSIFVPAPTTSGRRRKRGYDQAELLAKAFGQANGGIVRKLVTRTGQKHQVGSSGMDRRKQLRNAFNAKATSHKQVILVDDVLTTGATLEEAAKVLRAAGVKSVDAIVIAQA